MVVKADNLDEAHDVAENAAHGTTCGLIVEVGESDKKHAELYQQELREQEV